MADLSIPYKVRASLISYPITFKYTDDKNIIFDDPCPNATLTVARFPVTRTVRYDGVPLVYTE